jgi:hypothetical protein
MRGIGDEQVRPDARVETRIRPRAGMGGGHGFVIACVPVGEALVARIGAGDIVAAPHQKEPYGGRS